jgi:hypothetical protein
MFKAWSRKRRRKDPVCSRLRKLISPYSFGWEEPGGVGRYTNEQLIRCYNKHGFMGGLNNRDYYAHFAGQTTYYFWADGRTRTPETLACVDIDCHSRGNPRSAAAFAGWLAENYLPDLYHEPSTHGRGRHGYFVLCKPGLGDRDVVGVLGRLDRAIKKLLRLFLATHPHHEVEGVEIMGTPHLMTWGEGVKPRIDSMRSGKLAKIPRQILDRFDEFNSTTSLTFEDIRDLCNRVDAIVIPEPEVPSIAVSARKGSLSDHPVSEQEIAALKGPYLDLARSWIPQAIATSSRAKVDAPDLAIALAVIKSCSTRMNADGSMPTARIKAIWDRMYCNGEVDRAFDYHRWKAVRDLIEVKGGLVMVDRRYYTRFTNANGQEIKGKAARWHMAGWLMEELEEMAESGYRDEQEADQTLNFLPDQPRGGSLLERSDEEEEKTPSEAPWIVEFRQSFSPRIGLIWAGTIEDVPRLAA